MAALMEMSGNMMVADLAVLLVGYLVVYLVSLRGVSKAALWVASTVDDWASS